VSVVAFKARDGQRMFAFCPRTDPLDVLIELSWTHPEGVSSCGRACPTTEGSYCLDCHCIAANARDEAQRRMEASDAP